MALSQYVSLDEKKYAIYKCHLGENNIRYLDI